MFQAEDTFQFLWLLLIIPIVLLVWFAISWKKKTLKKIGDGQLVRQLFKGYSSQKFLLKAILPLIAMVFLALALVNYRKTDDSEKIKLNGTDLMIVLDVSNSMLAKDVQPNRLEKAKLLIGKLIDQLNGNRVGLIVFAGNAYPQMPLTTDASAAKLFLGSISPDLVPTQGTNISEALSLADRMLNTEEKKYKSILLISDGEDHDADAEITAKQLKDHGVIINTIGIGSPEGSQLYDPATNDVKRDAEGNIVISKLNEKALQDLAAATGGSYQLLGETEPAVKNELALLDGMDKRAISDTTFTNYKTYFYWFVVVAIVLLLIELLTSEKKKTMVEINKPAKKVLVGMLLLIASNAFSQKELGAIRKGNDAYKKQQFDVATKDYAEALKQNNNSPTANFNLGNTWFKAGKYDTAAQQYDALATNTHDKNVEAKSYYNKGVSLIKEKKLKEAIDAFKQSLKTDPSDEDTRQNLQKALKEMQKQQPPPPQDKKDKKKQDEKKPPPPKEDKKKDKNGEQPPPQSKLNKKEAEQKLQALREEEKKLKQKMDQQKQPTSRRTEKDW